MSSVYSSKYPTQLKIDYTTTTEELDGYIDTPMNSREIDSKNPTNEQLMAWQSVLRKLNDFQNSSSEVSRIISTFSNKMASLLLNTLNKIHDHTPNTVSNGMPILTAKEKLILTEMASEENLDIC